MRRLIMRWDEETQNILALPNPNGQYVKYEEVEPIITTHKTVCDNRINHLQTDNTALRAEIDRMQRIIDSRPAVNANLVETYIQWTRAIYIMDTAHANETPN